MGVDMLLLDSKVLSVVGILQDEVDPMLYVMIVEKAPMDSNVDIGGLEAQSHESYLPLILSCVQILVLSHPRV